MVRKAALVLALVTLHGAASAQTTTTCSTNYGTTTCNTTAPPPPPLDYGAISRAAEAAVPTYKPSISIPRARQSAIPRAKWDLSTGNSFAALCDKSNTSADDVAFGLCHGFIQGLMSRDEMGSGRVVCLPPSATNDQKIAVVLAWIGRHPADSHNDAGALAMIALNDAFPCASK